MSAVAALNKPRYIGRKVTREEYLDLDDDGFKYDMRQGVLNLAPSAYADHGENQNDVGSEFRMYFRSNGSGRVIAECDVFLPDGGDVVRPDISIVLKPNFGIIQKHIHGTPDIIVEILSPSTEDYDKGEKADRYLACGVKEYWLIDPKHKEIHLWINKGAAWEKICRDNLPSQILPGFVLAKSALALSAS